MSLGTVGIYRDDSVTPVIYENVEHIFMTANDTIITIAQVADLSTGRHRYVNWPREAVKWFYYEKPDE